MPMSFRAERTLTPDEAANPAIVDHARQAAFSEVMALADLELRGDPIPQDHAIDGAERPTDDGGLLIESILTIP